MRWMGLDLGDRRIGIALSDPLELTAQAFMVLERKMSPIRDLEFIEQLIREKEVGGIVLGLPKNMNGTEGPMAEKARLFGQDLEERCDIRVIFWDERLSTASAQRVLIEADLSRRKRKGKVDQVAAAIILQNYLDSQKSMKRP